MEDTKGFLPDLKDRVILVVMDVLDRFQGSYPEFCMLILYFSAELCKFWSKCLTGSTSSSSRVIVEREM